jgi:protease-4
MLSVLKFFGWFFRFAWKLVTWFYVGVGFVAIIFVVVIMFVVAEGFSSLEEESQGEFSDFSRMFGFGDYWGDFREPEALPERFLVHYELDDLLSDLDGEIGGSPVRRLFPEAMEVLASDERVEGVMVEMGLYSPSISEMQFLSRSMKVLFDSDKKVYVHGGNGLTMTSYALFQPSDELWLSPVGILGMRGYGYEQAYVGDFLGSVGIDSYVLKEGRYKTAADWLGERGASPYEREQAEALLEDWFAQTRSVSLGGRRLGEGSDFERLVSGGMHTSEEALEGGMVDGEGYYSDFEDLVVYEVLEARGKGCGDEEVDSEVCGDGVDFVDLHAYMETLRWDDLEESEESKRVAYVSLSGPIYSAPVDVNPWEGGDVGVNASYWVERFEEMGDDEDYEGVILRISSPGGEVGASDELWWALKRLNEKKPLVVVIDDVAASGGYYMAVAGERIVMERGAVTGSIGVVLGFLVYERMFERLGVNWERFARGRFATLFSDSRRPAKEDLELGEKIVGWYYEKFVERVADGRGLSPERVDELAQGRVWSGEAALELGLADLEGSVKEAEEELRALLSWEEDDRVELVVVERDVGFGDVLDLFGYAKVLLSKAGVMMMSILHSAGVNVDGRMGQAMMRAG